ncbi:MAG TPA: DUF2911 domain-containing protein [Chryseosolibacter sp.]|nr:DUF2911 domain-containing protein [Chryseosolibacter sp.]
MKVNSLFFFLALLIHGPLAFAQEAIIQQASPLAMTRARYKDTYLKITYSQPHRRGREIFGQLVPYGQVWRLGANEATELTTTHDILINDQILKAGTYSLFAMPAEDKWTFIINSETGLWGSYNHNPKLDVMRFDAPAGKTPTQYEPFTIKAIQSNANVDLIFLWDYVQVSFPVKFLN